LYVTASEARTFAYAQSFEDSVDEEHPIKALAQRLNLLDVLVAVRRRSLTGEHGVELGVVDHLQLCVQKLLRWTLRASWLMLKSLNAKLGLTARV
jgi:hypothetical protein